MAGPMLRNCRPASEMFLSESPAAGLAFLVSACWAAAAAQIISREVVSNVLGLNISVFFTGPNIGTGEVEEIANWMPGVMIFDPSGIALNYPL